MNTETEELLTEELLESEYLEKNETLDLESKEERKIIWQPKDFSLREFLSMKQDGDLDLQPEYQRKYVASTKIASRLIESILMDVPIPVIYLAEEKTAHIV